MKLIGELATAARSRINWIGVVITVAWLLPWIVIAIACVLAGVVGIQRGEHSMVICLPAGLALLVLPTLLLYLDSCWYPRVSGYILDATTLTYVLSPDSVPIHRQTDDVRWVGNRMSHGRTRGYLVKFRDGSGIYVCRALSNAEELARVLKESANNTWDSATIAS